MTHPATPTGPARLDPDPAELKHFIVTTTVTYHVYADTAETVDTAIANGVIDPEGGRFGTPITRLKDPHVPAETVDTATANGVPVLHTTDGALYLDGEQVEL